MRSRRSCVLAAASAFSDAHRLCVRPAACPAFSLTASCRAAISALAWLMRALTCSLVSFRACSAESFRPATRFLPYCVPSEVPARGTPHAAPCRARGTGGSARRVKAQPPDRPDPGMRYQDLGPDYYERQRDIRRRIARQCRQARRPRLRSHPRPRPRTRPGRPGTSRLTHTAPADPAGTTMARVRSLPHAQLISLFRVRRSSVHTCRTVPLRI